MYYIMYTMYTLLVWSIIYAISYTTKVWLILWISIALSTILTILYGGLGIILFIIELLIKGMFLYISYNLYKNPTESYTYVKVISNNSNKTKTKD
jgi:heme O synthase-like polyprenyltransferase